MNTQALILAAALAVLGTTASASEVSEGPTGVSTKTRAQVRAELIEAKRSGTHVEVNEMVSSAPVMLQSQRDRDSVRQEAIAALRASKGINPDLVGG